jgi:hypothetical protein
MPRATAAFKKTFTPSVPKYTPPVSAPSVVSVQRDTSLFGAVKEGFGLGVGIEAARSLFGGNRSQPQQVIHKSEPTEFERCIAEHKDDIALCAHLAQKKSATTDK